MPEGAFWDEAEAERLRQQHRAEQANRAREHPGDEIRFRFTRLRDIKISTAPPYVVHDMVPGSAWWWSGASRSAARRFGCST
jgi:hypothetical protein